MKKNHFVRQVWKNTRWIPLIFVLAFVPLLMHFKRELSIAKKHSRDYQHFFTKIGQKFQSQVPHFNGMALPPELYNIPFADELNIVTHVKKIKIRNIPAPYNACLIENDAGGYLLFFRYDEFTQTSHYPFFSYVGCAELDHQFNQMGREFKRIDTQSRFSEDPRVVKVGDALFLSFNDLLEHECFCRTMRVGRLNLKESKVDYVTDLDQHYGAVEKNWTPFEYVTDKREPKLYFEYFLNPHKILKLPNPQVNELVHLTFPRNPSLKKLNWPGIWGTPRGGTPARLVDGEYLAFFHSSFEDKDRIRWYLMGAYTFEAEPPFRVTAISQHPILFDGIYDSPPINTANPLLRCLFPCGFVVEKGEDKDLIHVSCGENDSAVKIVTLDKEALLKSLKKI